jgi:hypothetical protein
MSTMDHGRAIDSWLRRRCVRCSKNQNPRRRFNSSYAESDWVACESATAARAS